VTQDPFTLTATMNGANERPGPGDPNATGSATLVFNTDPADQKLDYTVTYANVDGTESGLHIHIAPPTSPGPIVIPFPTPTGSPAMGTVVIPNRALILNIWANPGQYYINLHSTPTYGAGAIRGTLQPV
jgi:hypothetical protein